MRYMVISCVPEFHPLSCQSTYVRSYQSLKPSWHVLQYPIALSLFSRPQFLQVDFPSPPEEPPHADSMNVIITSATTSTNFFIVIYPFLILTFTECHSLFDYSIESPH